MTEMTGRLSVRVDDETAHMLDELVVALGARHHSEVVRTGIRFLWRDMFGRNGPTRREDDG